MGRGSPGPVSVLMLAYNEAEVIESVVRAYHAEVVARLPGSEFIVGEDGSRDGTTEILQRLAGELGLRLIQHGERRGYTRALRDGLAAARNDLVFFSDSDGQHDPHDFWRLAHRIAHADLVIGYKRPRRDPAYRLVMSRVFNALVGRLFDLRLHDVNSGFRLFRRACVDDLLRDEWRLSACIGTELTVRAHLKGYTVVEVPVRHLPRSFGPSRGVPLTRIPRDVRHVVRELVGLRRDARSGRL